MSDSQEPPTDDGPIFGFGDPVEPPAPATDADTGPDAEVAAAPAGPSGDGVDRLATSRPGRRRSRSRASGWLPVVGILAVVLVVALVLVPRGIDKVKSHFAGADDYPGPGSGQVCFTVASGDTVTDTGRALKAAGVVASVEAFTSAASGSSIRDGSYELKKQMSASDAAGVLDQATSRSCLTQFTIVSGHTEAETIALLAKATDFSVKQLNKAAAQPAALGLPAYAKGQLEGYLGSGTYEVEKGDTPVSLLRQMVASFTKTADSIGLVDGADRLGYTPEQIVIVASLIQKEVGKPVDQAKVARVIYNRLENPGTAGTAGYLQLDSTINYATGKQGFDLTPADLGVDSPYNTRTHLGLPPGAIDSPGKAALQAALNPTPGDWYYYVTVNPRTQETKFATNYDQFLTDKAEFDQYCQTSTAC